MSSHFVISAGVSAVSLKSKSCKPSIWASSSESAIWTRQTVKACSSVLLLSVRRAASATASAALTAVCVRGNRAMSFSIGTPCPPL